VAKVKIHRDADLSKRYPAGIPNRLTVTMDDGRQFVKEVEFPRGHAQNRMTDEEVEHKFRTLVEPRYGKRRTKQILKELWGMEKAAAKDMVKLFD
jgi:2-methylcitrate dehydratase